jgi:hypothetical protein
MRLARRPSSPFSFRLPCVASPCAAAEKAFLHRAFPPGIIPGTPIGLQVPRLAVIGGDGLSI